MYLKRSSTEGGERENGKRVGGWVKVKPAKLTESRSRWSHNATVFRDVFLVPFNGKTAKYPFGDTPTLIRTGIQVRD